MTSKIIDSHAHLDDKSFNPDLDDVILRARDAGIVRIIVPGTHPASSRKAVEIAARYPEVFAAVGVHPHEASRHADSIESISKLLDLPKVIAIGEIGLDYHYDFAPKAKQLACLLPQLELARERNLPVVLHSRESVSDLLDALDRTAPPPWRGVFHCFGGTPDEADEILKRGFHIGFTGVVTFKNFDGVETLRWVPPDRLLIETDAPYMTPIPHRGKRNEPAYLPGVADAVARLTGRTVEDVIRETTQNAEALFGFGDPS
jgi:TatD DNase family protein